MYELLESKSSILPLPRNPSSDSYHSENLLW